MQVTKIDATLCKLECSAEHDVVGVVKMEVQLNELTLLSTILCGSQLLFVERVGESRIVWAWDFALVDLSESAEIPARTLRIPWLIGNVNDENEWVWQALLNKIRLHSN